MKRILSGKGDHTTTVGSNDTFTTQCEYESVVDGSGRYNHNIST